MRKAAGLALLLATLVLPAAASARPEEHLRLEGATTFPIAIGPRMVAELPGRIRLATSVGWLPPFYVDAINDVAMAFGGYDEDTARVIRDSLDSSLVWRTDLGWRPFGGFYFEAGYGLVTLGGGTSEATVLALLFGREPPEDAGRRYDVESTLHMLDVEIGWEWWIVDRVSIRAGLGGAFTLDANSSVEPTFPAPEVITKPFTRRAEHELDDILERYVQIPTASFAVGVRLF